MDEPLALAILSTSRLVGRPWRTATSGGGWRRNGRAGAILRIDAFAVIAQAVSCLNLRDSVDGPVQEDRLVRLAYLGRESTFRSLKILGTPAAGSHNIPWGGSRNVGLVAGVSYIIPRVIR